MSLAWIMRERIWSLPLPAPVFQVMRSVLKRRVVSLETFRSVVAQKTGLEIGGPSDIFRDGGELPIYRQVARLDNCVFSSETIWEGRREEGRTFSYHPRQGQGFNFIKEGSDLYGIGDHTYDFVLSSHNLEHIANPIKALREWMRVVIPSGAIIAILPEYRFTFDHHRRPTPLAHMIEDFDRGTDERDLTHLGEILELHDLALDPSA
jgi:SAM-dependent methyltransferase